MEIGIGLLAVLGQRSVKKEEKKKEKERQVKAGKRSCSLEGALFKKVGHSKTRWRILGNYLCCFTFPVSVGTNPNLRKSGGSGYLLGKAFHNEGNTNIGTGGVFLRLFFFSPNINTGENIEISPFKNSLKYTTEERGTYRKRRGGREEERM